MTAILHIISGLGTGGAETTLAQIAGTLQARGISQHIVSIGDSGSHRNDLEDRSVAVTALGVKSIFGAPLGIFRLVRLIERLQPSVIQGWMYHGDLMALFGHRLARRRADRRLYWNLRASNIGQAGYGWLIRLCAYFSHLPDLVIANSEAGAAYHVKLGYRPRRLEVVANGIDTDKFRPDAELRKAVRAELKIAPDAVLVIHVARVHSMKDHETFLAAMAAIPRIEAVMVGSGTERLRVPANVRALGLRRDVARIYAAGDIVVSTSAFGEGFSNAIAEGMSAGLVPIATDIGDARRIVHDTGAIVAIGDAAGLAARIAEEAALSADQRRARGLNARARIQEKFSLSRAVESFARLYAPTS